jgi:hypothetical protein
MKRSERRSSSSNKSFFFNSPTPFFFYPFPPLPDLFHPSYLHSVFLPVPFSPSLISLHPFHICSIDSLSTQHILQPLFSPFIQYLFSLIVPTSESPHHFSFPCTLSPQIPSLRSCLSVSLSPSLSSTFIHLPFALNLSTSSLAYQFLW